MKKSTIYIITLILFVAAVGFVLYKYNADKTKEQTTDYTLLDRTGPSAQTAEWKATQTRAAGLIQSIHADPNDTKSKLGLATLFIQEARVTGNYAYYDMAALKYVNDVLKTDSANFDGLVLKSVLYLSQHHFADGLAIAQKARAINPYNSFVYGMLVDGNVEMGNYDSAVANAQRMVDIRPDMRSYSRISYLREIHGDYPGAIDAMKLAVQAGVPGDEGTEWSRAQLGHLYENSGDLKNAEMQYDIALQERPNYAYALAGLARIATAQKDYNKAINYYSQADSSVNDFAIKEALADVYQLSNQKQKAKDIMKLVIDDMNKQAQSGQNNENIGHYVDKELAYAYLKENDYDKALEHALMEYNRRPNNIDVNEAVAWVYYCKGDYAKAVPYIKTALKTNSKNPTLLCRAGLIFAKTGNKDLAKANLQNALKTNANIEDGLKTQSINTLQTL
ncbi:MAG: tetratricopeptide repeat protein [Chitinophagaceae bacterium]